MWVLDYYVLNLPRLFFCLAFSVRFKTIQCHTEVEWASQCYSMACHISSIYMRKQWVTPRHVDWLSGPTQKVLKSSERLKRAFCYSLPKYIRHIILQWRLYLKWTMTLFKLHHGCKSVFLQLPLLNSRSPFVQFHNITLLNLESSDSK